MAKEAKRLAEKYGICQNSAEIAGFLHDISRVIASKEYVNIATKLGVDVKEEEKTLPDLLHQKLSKVIAKELFCVKDKDILNSVNNIKFLKTKIQN